MITIPIKAQKGVIDTSKNINAENVTLSIEAKQIQTGADYIRFSLLPTKRYK